MGRHRILILGLLAFLGIAATACATTENAEYTVRTEKWSRAPREKFYRIIKVPKTPEKAAEPSRPKDGQEK